MFSGEGRTIMMAGVANPSAMYLVEQGYRVVLCAHSQEWADQLSEQIPEEYRDRCISRYCMVGEEESTLRCLREVEERFGGLDALVLGIGMNEDAHFAETNGQDFQNIVSGHLFPVYNGIKQCLPLLLKSPSPRLITFTCVDGRCGRFDYGVGSAAGKGALVSLTRNIALEYARDGLTANCIAIGALENLRSRQPQQVQALEERIPLGRLARPEDIAPAICFLASEESRYITGAVLNVSGGAYFD